MKKRKLSIRSVTHEGQKTSDQLNEMKTEFADYISNRINDTGSTIAMVLPGYIGNCDETGVNFEQKPSTWLERSQSM